MYLIQQFKVSVEHLLRTADMKVHCITISVLESPNECNSCNLQHVFRNKTYKTSIYETVLKMIGGSHRKKGIMSTFS